MDSAIIRNMQTVILKKKFNKGDFKAGASVLKIGCWYLISLCFFRSGLMPFSIVLVSLLRLFGAKIGKDVRIKPGIFIRYPWKLLLGNHCWLADCYIDNLDFVSLGDHVCISQQAMLLTGNHDYNSKDFDLRTGPINLKDGVWVCARAIVCPGLTLFSHAVLCSGAVAQKDLRAYAIYQGNPAICVKKRNIKP